MAGKRPPKSTDVPKGEPVGHARRSVNHTNPEPRNVLTGKVVDHPVSSPAAPSSSGTSSSGTRATKATGGRHRPAETKREKAIRVGGGAAKAAAPHAQRYAQRAHMREMAGAKPSVSGGAVKGGSAGLAAGAAIGAVLAPVTAGLSEPIGAAAGAVLGGTVGAVAGSKKKKAWKRAAHADTAGPRRLILAEFILCLVIVALSPLTDTELRDKPGAWMKRMTALMALFLVLSMVGSAGRGAAKVSAGLGGVVALVLLVSDRDLLVKLAKIFANDSTTGSTHGGVGHKQVPTNTIPLPKQGVPGP